MRAALYAGVSTRDQQTLPMQLKIMKEYVKNRGWDAVIQIEETSSGIKECKKPEAILIAAK